MKILTKEEEAAHYSATLKGGGIGGSIGILAGLAATYGAQQRFPAFRGLTLPLKAFLVTSAGTFAAIISADSASRKFEIARRPDEQYKDKARAELDFAKSQESVSQRLFKFGKENRYPIVTGSWVASMGIALGLVGRSPYLSTAQKLVQARVYAQGLTLAVLIATAAFEVGDAKKGEGRYETIKVLDPDDPNHNHLIEKRVHHERYAGEDQWRDMVEAEEAKLKERDDAIHKQEEEDRKEKLGNSSKKSSDKSSGKDQEKFSSKSSDGKESGKKDSEKKDSKDEDSKGEDSKNKESKK